LKYSQKYIIPFKGLKNGKHIFRFKLDRSFFNLFEVEEINNVDLSAEIQVDKKISYVELDLNIRGYIEVICDVCLEFYAQKIESNGKLFIRFGEESTELSDELIVVPFNQNEIEISQYLFDYSMLGLPFKKQHTPVNDGESGCDPEMLRILKNMEVKEENPGYDPRWNNLKKLKY
jgi:uncharacterized protein